ncbi:3-oxoadipate enol-lactonase [Pseudonocardia kunmingensis]|uniref:3-oxoadipate enol-lactonase n=1 Tax=Pseudonocardia kunmingensis TaxID=630975 RepID=A0A543E3C0_9PSEU|nr:3-oxoadipate enol-lactonase [Pseudonocardia kunmingensis]TQM16095.1 3-oxoadipate enol-lactonase [Pseudonocardia kunmingensis]
MTVDLHHLDEGPRDAPPLVLSGSLGSTLEMWRPQVAALTERFRVIRVDHRGHGGSAVPPGPYRIADLAGDVLALLDRLGLDRVAWCGLSLGGMVGMHLASEAPERISRLTLCCTTAHFPDPTPWEERIAAVSSGGTGPLAQGVVARWFTPGWAAAHADVVAEAEAMVAGTPDDGYLACCQAIEAWDHRDRLGAISAPTLVIAGSGDLATPVEPHARTLAEGIPGARLEVLDAAHLASVEAADEVTALIAEISTP